MASGAYLEGGKGIRSHLKVGHLHLFEIVLKQRSFKHQPASHNTTAHQGIGSRCHQTGSRKQSVSDAICADTEYKW